MTFAEIAEELLQDVVGSLRVDCDEPAIVGFTGNGIGKEFIPVFVELNEETPVCGLGVNKALRKIFAEDIELLPYQPHLHVSLFIEAVFLCFQSNPHRFAKPVEYDGFFLQTSSCLCQISIIDNVVQFFPDFRKPFALMTVAREVFVERFYDPVAVDDSVVEGEIRTVERKSVTPTLVFSVDSPSQLEIQENGEGGWIIVAVRLGNTLVIEYEIGHIGMLFGLCSEHCHVVTNKFLDSMLSQALSYTFVIFGKQVLTGIPEEVEVTHEIGDSREYDINCFDYCCRHIMNHCNRHTVGMTDFLEKGYEFIGAFRRDLDIVQNQLIQTVQGTEEMGAVTCGRTIEVKNVSTVTTHVADDSALRLLMCDSKVDNELLG